MADVTILNTITGKTGKVRARVYNSAAFNKDDVWVLYDGDLEPDCGCNGQTIDTSLETPELHEGDVEIENDPYDESELEED